MKSSRRSGGGTPRVQHIGLVAGPFASVVIYSLLSPGLGTGDGLSEAGRLTAAVAAWMACWWLTEAVPLAVTALLPIVLCPLLGACTIGEATARYAHPLIYLFLGGFILGLGMQRWGLHTRIALQTIRLVGTRPTRLIAGFMLATAVLSMFVSNTATAVMLVPIAMRVAELVRVKLGEDQAKLFTTALLLSIAFAASIGGVGTLIGTPPNTLLAAFVRDRYAVEIGFARWMLVGIPLVAVFLPLAWHYLVHWRYRIDDAPIPGGRHLIEKSIRDLGPMSRGEWTVMIVFCITATCWVTRPMLVSFGESVGGPLALLANLSDAGIALSAAVVLFVIPVDIKKNVFALDWETAGTIPWGILILFGGGLSLANIMSLNGVDAYIGSGFKVLGGLPAVVVLLAIVLVVKFLTELTSNTAVTSALLPVLGGAAISMGMDNPMPILAAAALSASLAFMLPVATPPNAIAFSSGVIPVREMARAGFVLNLVATGLITAVAWLLIPLVLKVSATG